MCVMDKEWTNEIPCRVVRVMLSFQIRVMSIMPGNFSWLSSILCAHPWSPLAVATTVDGGKSHHPMTVMKNVRMCLHLSWWEKRRGRGFRRQSSCQFWSAGYSILAGRECMDGILNHIHTWRRTDRHHGWIRFGNQFSTLKAKNWSLLRRRWKRVVVGPSFELASRKTMAR